ncbi:uncharacterized protein AB675_2329 [Cyphellophora attinorum]|uniref:AB hydrolase-1 domain-containing protein n=1 Tax=Cyphellophora attinorum TaxID=1664694 RepID=A0A0N0NRD5_9EURO|nr:uncharacterized protein AB675_2329 [Phialophora attinorum]KPI44968.1 hypothetical protein AB675_2329 [Phialophora attinorum]
MTLTRIRATTTTKDGIKWYYEQEGSGPDVILVPDGLGDCAVMDRPMSLIAASGFRVTTVDMPGMSRSSAPLEACRKVTPRKLALQINNLLEHLDIDNATVWGCSSGALCALGLCAYYPDRLRNVFMHEAPLQLLDMLKDLPQMDDRAIVDAMVPISRQMAGDPKAQEAWDQLPKEVHARIEKNFIVWAHGYISDLTFNLPLSDQDLHQRPIAWSVGASTPMAAFFNNVVTATKASLPISLLPGGHFPYVTHPEEMARYIVEITRKYV